MRSLYLALAFVLAAGIAVAQNPIGPTSAAGRFDVSQYASYTLRTMNNVSAGSQTVYVDQCYPNFGTNVHQFFPLAVIAPLTIVDGPRTETATPTQVNRPTQTKVGDLSTGQYTCSFVATFANAHLIGAAITSATGGLEEAISDAHGQGGGVVDIDASWPGTTASITTTIVGFTDVVIEDLRGVLNQYSWNGTHYVISGGGGPGGSGTVTNTTGPLPSNDFILGNGGADVKDSGFSVIPKILGGTGTTTPALVAGTNVTITGAWPNQTVNSTATATPPGGSTNQLQANVSGSFAGVSNDTAGKILTSNGPSSLPSFQPAPAGTLSATPQNSVQVSGASGALSSANVRYVNATNYMWTQSPSGTLTAATPATITLTPCPLGVDGTDTWSFVRIATTGTPEDTKITGGSCTGGATSGTITITPANTHSAGYSIASSTAGFQEASNDARITPSNPTGSVQSGVVIAAPGEYTWTATMTIRASLQVFDFSGTIIDCNMAAACLFLGNPASLLDTLKPTVKNFRARAVNAAATTFPAIEDNASGAFIDGVSARNSLSTARFGYLVQIDGDEASSTRNVDPSTATNAIRCDATFCGAAYYNPGPFASNAAVGWLSDSNLTMNCGGNGIDWHSGNTLRVQNTVIQGYSQYGVRVGTANGGFGGYQADNVYMEGGCSNPLGNVGTAGLIVRGNSAVIRGGEGPAGAFPTFNTQGGTRRNYYIVVHDSVLGVSTALFAGSGTPTSGTITVTWPQITGTNTITYDVLATSGVVSITNSVVPIGTANQAVHGSVGISGSCSAGVCTATDTFATPLDSYTLAQPTYFPILNFWPGSVVLSPAGDSSSFATTALLYTDESNSNIVSETNVVPTVFATRCESADQYMSIWISCLAGNSSQFGSYNAATVLENSQGNGQFGFTGRLNIGISNRDTYVGPVHLLTLLDSNPTLTTSYETMRRPYSASDSYIGIDNPAGGFGAATAHLAEGTPVQFSWYIASNPDNSSYKMRLNSSTLTLKLPLNLSTLSASSLLCTDGSKNVISGCVGGSDTQVQFNDAGSLNGDAGFTYNKTTDTATLGAVAAGSVATTGTGNGIKTWCGRLTGCGQITTDDNATKLIANLPVQTTTVLFAALPTCNSSSEGAMRAITDSTTATWGATISGGSTNHVLAYCDGTNWTVAAK